MGAVRFNKIFKEANESRHRYKVLMGSAGSGKSQNVAQDYIVKLTDPQYAGCSLLCMRGVEVSHYNSTFAELVGAINRMGLQHIYKTRLNPLSIMNKVNGNEIVFRGCSDAKALERLKSVTVQNGKITWCWIEEATEITADNFNIINDRLRGKSDNPNAFFQLCLTFNPVSATHWIKSQLWDYDSPDIFCHHSTYLQNAFIDEAYKAAMLRRREVDPDGYRIYGLGEWGEQAGLVLTNIEIGDYSRAEFEHYSMGSDFGYNHYHSTLLIGWRDGNPYVIREVAEREKTTAELIELCDKAQMPKNVTMWCESAEPDRIKEFRQAGYRAYPVSKEKNVTINQINFLKGRKIYIDGRCEHLHKEIQAYKWKRDPKSGEYLDCPVEFNDDSIKALMYGCEEVRKAKSLKTMGKEVLGI